MLLKTTFLPLWLASLGASNPIPIQSEFWCCPVDGNLSTPNLKECICPPSESKRELDGDLYNYVDGDSVNYKVKREQDSGLYSKPPKGTCKGGGPGCFCPNGEPGCTPPQSEEEEAKRELDGDLYNYVDGDSVNYKAKREQDSGLYSKPPKGNPGYPYCPGPVGCPPP